MVSGRIRTITHVAGRALSGEGGLAQVEAYPRGDPPRTVPRKGALLWLRVMRHVLHRTREGRVCVPRRWHEPHRAARAQGARQGKGLWQPRRPALRRHRRNVLRHQHTPLLRRTAGTGKQAHMQCPQSPHGGWRAVKQHSVRGPPFLIRKSSLVSAGCPPMCLKGAILRDRRAHRRTGGQRLGRLAASTRSTVLRRPKPCTIAGC